MIIDKGVLATNINSEDAFVVNDNSFVYKCTFNVRGIKQQHNDKEEPCKK